MGKLKDNYNALPKRTGARADYVSNVSKLTKASTGTVYHWLRGTRNVSKLARKVLSHYFLCEEEEV